jgi:hypothetical protein
VHLHCTNLIALRWHCNPNNTKPPLERISRFPGPLSLDPTGKAPTQAPSTLPPPPHPPTCVLLAALLSTSLSAASCFSCSPTSTSRTLPLSHHSATRPGCCQQQRTRFMPHDCDTSLQTNDGQQGAQLHHMSVMHDECLMAQYMLDPGRVGLCRIR